ncbi:MAG: hypothetical protein ACYCU0_13755 [Solirubrobacteraceae bacterium]
MRAARGERAATAIARDGGEQPAIRNRRCHIMRAMRMLGAKLDTTRLRAAAVRAVAKLRARGGRELCALLALGAALTVTGCATTSPPPIARGELAAARTFPYYTVYWVGRSFEKHPLTAADGVRGYKPNVGDSVYYGDCLRSKSALGGGGCVLPLQVTTLIYTMKPNFTLGPQRNVLIRGVPAVSFNEGKSLILYSGRLAIEIFSNDYAAAHEAAKLLRPLNGEGSDKGDLPLPLYCPLLHGPETEAVQITMQRLPGKACEEAAKTLREREQLTGEPVNPEET